MTKIICPKCRTVALLAEEHLGRQVACSACKNVYVTTAPNSAAKPSEVKTPSLTSPSPRQPSSAKAPSPAPARKSAPATPSMPSTVSCGAAKTQPRRRIGWMLAMIFSLLAVLVLSTTGVVFWIVHHRGVERQAADAGTTKEEASGVDEKRREQTLVGAANDTLSPNNKLLAEDTPPAVGKRLESDAPPPAGKRLESDAPPPAGKRLEGGSPPLPKKEPGQVAPLPSKPKSKPKPPPNGEIPKLPAKPIQITFLNTTAKGQRFCIIADNSGSMMGKPMEFVKRELAKTLGDLKPESQFYVMFFNNDAEPMPFASWLQGTPKNVNNVSRWIKGKSANGGTNPQPAFERAFNLDPRPDVIFFMTDGLIPLDVPASVAAMNNGKPRVTIHTIMFTSDQPLALGLF
ncbi:MAG: hypothetical protein ACRELF_12350, partial [Gemmataceae bacterium]